ncbi:MAG TPA: ATP-binding protein [Hanamia sp.]|nr:ATP-binding protein [Hanamia sp.]
MKKLITFILVIFSVTNLHAQRISTDSLKLLLSKEKTDTGRVNLFTAIGGRFGFGMMKNDSSMWYLEQAQNLSKRIHYTKGELNANFNMAKYLFFSGNYPGALTLSLQNLKQSEQLRDTNILFFQTRLLVWIYNRLEDNENALRFAKKMSSIANSGFQIQDSILNYRTMSDAMLGTAFSNAGKLDSALRYQSLVYKYALKIKDPQWFSLGSFWLGGTYSKMGKEDSAFYYYRISIPNGIKSKRFDMEAGSELGMANLFYKQGQSDSAFFYTKQAVKVLQNISTPDVLMDAYSLLSKLYEGSNRYDSAYKYLKRSVTLKDSLFNQSKLTQAQNFVFNESIQQQKIEQAKKEAQQQYKAKIKLEILAAVILIFLIIAFLLLRNIRNKRKANILLSNQKEEIEEQKRNVESTLSELKSTQKQLIQSEKMASLGELTAGIAHEIQNPLNFVNNFSDVNKELIDEMQQEMDKGNLADAKEISNDIKENSEKINHHGKRAGDIVKGMLQHSRTSTGVKEPTDINALADEYLRLSYHGLRAKDKSFNAEMKTDFDETIGKINIIPQDIGRVLLNLFNNAFYAVNEKQKLFTKDLPGFKNLAGLDGYNPTVSVKTKRSENSVLITVSDNGNGIPKKIVDKIFQPFFTTKPTGSGTGLGLSLSYDIVKAHGGEIKVNTKEGEARPDGPRLNDSVGQAVERGTEFIIQLPLKENV